MLMCKQLLGVHNCTTNIGVLLELGRISLKIHAIKLAVKNWERIKKIHANGGKPFVDRKYKKYPRKKRYAKFLHKCV